MGGASAEREISLQTGAQVCKALAALGYAVSSLEFDDRFVDALRERKPAAVFNALHGGAGEDGTVQALLDWLRIPYQGSGVRASALAMDKWLSKAVMQVAGVPTPRAQIVDLTQAAPADAPVLPCVVKPAAEGSALGVALVRSAEQWRTALERAAEYGTRVLAEEYVQGREFTVAILAGDALPVVEIAPHDEFYSYHAKYTPGGSRHIVPASLPSPTAIEMQRLALRLHRALGCRDYSRIDVLLEQGSGRLFFLECNTLPGLTPLSLFPDAAAAAGIAYEALVDTLVHAALSRAHAAPHAGA
jgi:D-alanine-D-alanine ligase